MPPLALGRAGLFCCFYQGTSCYTHHLLLLLLLGTQEQCSSLLEPTVEVLQTLWWTTGREKQHKHRAFPIHLRKSSQYCSQFPISTALHVQEESEWAFNPHPPQPCALPSHKPPWRGPLGTKGEILQMHTSWLALGTGEEHAVSTAPPAPACPASQSLTG